MELGKDAKLYVTERLMTDGEQKAESNIEVQLNGEDSSAQIVSRSVGKGTLPRPSIQMPSVTANARLISSVILSSWIMQRSVQSLKSGQKISMRLSYMRQQLADTRQQQLLKPVHSDLQRKRQRKLSYRISKLNQA